ncbi:MAG: 30S ribosome-binding factor RbfA [Candidatus Melainabacteria bacterium]|nr:30S ribosome-binding factor RbfA [Candidatus Melainabacteria bacterium]MBI3309519.1 30S ribosome-binding factor RbfA [Candidatus Melainabacteria bacterium]
MKSYNRSDRISQQIKRELSEIIQRNEIKDDRLGGLVSITDVRVSNDIRNVKVFFSVYGEESQKVGTLAALEHSASFLRGELCRRLRIKFAPELTFVLDDSLEKGDKIIELLDKIKRDEA